MPNEVKQLEGGKLEVILETGERFVGDPLEVTNKMAEAHVNTKRWGQAQKTEAENLKAEVNKLSAPPPPPQNPQNVEEANLQRYLLEQTAKGLGYSSAEEYQNDLKRVKSKTDDWEAHMTAMEFQNRRPDFPNTAEAQEKLFGYMAQNNWPVSVPSMVAAHDTLVREKAYEPLSTEQQNASWANSMQNASGTNNRRPVPPPSVPSRAPDASQTGDWYEQAAQMPLDKLREQILNNARNQR